MKGLKISAVWFGLIPTIFCANCKPGYFDGAHDYGCEPCPKNTYKSDTGPQLCTRCLPGLITNQTGSTSSDHCYQPCPDGQVIDTLLQTCQPCSENHYRNGSMRTCFPCDEGRVTMHTGSTSVSECVPCPSGTYRQWLYCKNSSSATICRRNATEDFISNTSCNHNCPVSHPNYTWSDYCQPCPLNFYKNEGEISCTACPNGTTTTQVGACDVSWCTEKGPISGGLTVSVAIPTMLLHILLVGGRFL